MLSDVWLSDVCLSVSLSVAYIGPKSITERPNKTKIGTKVAHVTRDSDAIFKVKRSKVKVTRGGGILLWPPALLVIDVFSLLMHTCVSKTAQKIHYRFNVVVGNKVLFGALAPAQP